MSGGRQLGAHGRRASGSVVLLVALVAVLSCSDRSERPLSVPGSGGVPGPPLPPACQLVTPADVEGALGTAVTADGRAGQDDRCRYVSRAGDDVEITVDRPGFTGAVGAYLGLNPDAERVEGIGDEGALRLDDGKGELLFVKGHARFFVVVTGRPSSREALVTLGGAAARRL